MNRVYPGTPTGPSGFPAQSPVQLAPTTPTLPGPPPYGAPGTPTDSSYYGSLHNVAVPSPLNRGVSVISIRVAWSGIQVHEGGEKSVQYTLCVHLLNCHDIPPL